MIVVCPSCASRFQYADERFQGARSKHFKCPKCATTFEVQNPAAAPARPAPAPAPAPPPKATETSRSRRVATDPSAIQEFGIPTGLRFTLAFLTGPLASTVRVLETSVTVIGREEGDVVINDPEISRRHARLEIHLDGTVWLSDLESTNGTFIGTTPVTEPTLLMDRQEFSCGRSTFMLLVRDTKVTGMELT